jgi:hypothetical protein
VKQFIVEGRFVFNGSVVVEAETADEARTKFAKGEFEYDVHTVDLCDWEFRSLKEDS